MSASQIFLLASPCRSLTSTGSSARRQGFVGVLTVQVLLSAWFPATARAPCSLCSPSQPSSCSDLSLEIAPRRSSRSQPCSSHVDNCYGQRAAGAFPCGGLCRAVSPAVVRTQCHGLCSGGSGLWGSVLCSRNL